MTRPVISGRYGIDPLSATATAPGTFGELLQGMLPDGTAFLVTLPITLTSRVSVRLTDRGGVQVYPAHKTKSRRVAERILVGAGHRGGAVLVIDSPLPIGKGLASSSADLVATARAVARSVDASQEPEQIADWIRGIEPTDGVMYPEVVVFDHQDVRLRQTLGRPPDLTVVAVDEGGQVDTVAFNRDAPQRSAPQRAEYRRLLAELTDAFGRNDVAAIGRIATDSAILNQQFNPRRNLEAMLAIADQTDAVGVVCTHSGTMLGLAIDRDAPGAGSTLAAVRLRCRELPGRLYEFTTAPLRGSRGP